MNFVAIDIKCAGFEDKDISSIGVAVVENNLIVSSREFLIDSKGKHSRFNLLSNEIEDNHIKNIYGFPMVWNEIRPLLEGNLVVAFNANVQMNLLLDMLGKYQIEIPTLNFACSRFAAKKLWRNLDNYMLSTIADSLEIDYREGNSEENAIVCSEIFLRALQVMKFSAIEELYDALKLQLGHIDSTKYSSVGRGLQNNDAANKTKERIQSLGLKNKNVVFTGTLESMVRREAMRKVISIGGFCSGTVNQNTDVLVVGVQSRAKLRGKTKSSKMLRAERFKEEGKNIMIITEDEFLKMIL